MGGAPLRLLLDTHVWLWSLLEPEKLSRRIVGELESSGNQLWLSSISVWETLILAEKGRLVLDLEPQAWLEQAMSRAPMVEAPVTHEIARQSRLVGLPHEDPVDRFLAATAKVLELTLVSADERLLQCPNLAVLPAR